MPSQHLRLRTWQQHRVGNVLLTVALESGDEDRNIERQRRLWDFHKRLIRLLSAHRLPATWAASDPAHSPATPHVIRSTIDHETALLGDASWVGTAAGRTQFARELVRRTLQARAVGIPITSLVSNARLIRPHLDLVVKQGITAIVAAESTGGQLQRPTPKAVHYGVWELPATERLPLRSTWFGGGVRSLARQIRRCAEEAATFHLFIDAPTLADETERAEKTVGRIARHIAELRDRGLVEVETLSGAAARLAAVPAAVPQRSILRLAA